jgi:hypothetical protein
MNMHSRGFVDDQDIFVLVQDFERQILSRDFTWEIERNAYCNGGIRGKWIPRTDGFSCHSYPVLLHPLLDSGSGFTTQAC